MKRDHHRIITVFSIIAIATSLVAINLLSSRYLSPFRLDVTQEHLFTLSSGSKKILSEIEEPISLKLYFSKKLAKDNPYFMSFAQRVEEFLKQ